MKIAVIKIIARENLPKLSMSTLQKSESELEAKLPVVTIAQNSIWAIDKSVQKGVGVLDRQIIANR